jgi:hypothetical protein
VDNLKIDISEEVMNKAINLTRRIIDVFKEDPIEPLTPDEVARLALYIRFIIDVDQGNVTEEEFHELLSLSPSNSNQLH